MMWGKLKLSLSDLSSSQATPAGRQFSATHFDYRLYRRALSRMGGCRQAWGKEPPRGHGIKGCGSRRDAALLPQALPSMDKSILGRLLHPPRARIPSHTARLPLA